MTHSRSKKTNLQCKSGTENRCCGILMWGYFSPQNTKILSFMWWRQDVQLVPSLRSPPLSLAPIFHLWNTGPWSVNLAQGLWTCSQKNGPLAKPRLHQQKTLQLSFCPVHTLSTQHWRMQEEAYNMCPPSDLMWQLFLCKTTFLLLGVVLLQGDTWGFFPMLLNWDNRRVQH